MTSWSHWVTKGQFQANCQNWRHGCHISEAAPKAPEQEAVINLPEAG